jgi:DNA-binding transcriptional regulator GbsR (MarR family)
MILSSKKNSTSLKCYLGLFNSKLFYYFIKKTSTPYNNNYFYFKTNYIEPFSIPITLQLNNDIFEKIVDEILTAKKVNPESDTTALEQQIDNMVYKLYQLTYQEVKIIDPEFALTEQEYADIKLETV